MFAWDAGDKAYAVMVDNEEADDVDIVDITDPKKPVLGIAEYNLATKFPQILQAAPPNLVEVFLHDLVVKEIAGRQVMLLSYWDAGYVALDMTDPLDPTYIGDTDFTNPDPQLLESAGITAPPEGNGHQSELTGDNKCLIGADEDFGPLSVLGQNLDDGTDITSGQGSGTRLLLNDQVIEGRSVFVGSACNGDPAVPAGDSPRFGASWVGGSCSTPSSQFRWTPDSSFPRPISRSSSVDPGYAARRARNPTRRVAARLIYSGWWWQTHSPGTNSQ